MAQTVTLNYAGQFNWTETPNSTAPDVAALNAQVQHTLLSNALNLNANTTPPATAGAAFLQALAAGVATVSLAALPGYGGATINGTGLKVRAYKFQNPASNANAITIKFGASNPYLLLGAAWSIVLNPGDEVQGLVTAAPTVAGGALNIDLSGTGTQALNIALILG